MRDMDLQGHNIHSEVMTNARKMVYPTYIPVFPVRKTYQSCLFIPETLGVPARVDKQFQDTREGPVVFRDYENEFPCLCDQVLHRKEVFLVFTMRAGISYGRRQVGQRKHLIINIFKRQLLTVVISNTQGITVLAIGRGDYGIHQLI